MIKLHASVVEIEGKAVLLRGPSGAGKSDLALRLIDEGATLVSDDYVELHTETGQIIARAPTEIAGLLEVRGFGLMTFPVSLESPVAVVFDLMETENIDRMPSRSVTLSIDGLCIPLLQIDSKAASAPARVRLALSRLDSLMDKTGKT